MPTVVMLSDELVEMAQLSAQANQLTLSEQIEKWAVTGQKISVPEGVSSKVEERVPLTRIIAEVGTPAGDARVAAYLENRPYPHFEPVPGRVDEFIRIDQDGSRVRGKIVDRRFLPEG